jgi:hypothetical protein
VRPAAIHHEILRRDHLGVVGGEEQRHAGDVGRVEAAGERLLLVDQAIGGIVDQWVSCRSVMIQRAPAC